MYAPRFLALALALLLFGCSKLTLDNYAKLKTGMDYGAVKALLGEPARCSEALGVKGCQWGDDAKGIKVNFVADKAILFSSTNLN